MNDGPAIYLPMGFMYPNPQMRRSSAILGDESHIRELTAALGGRTAKPRKAITIWAPDGVNQIILIGAGETEAAELEDMAYRAFDEARETMKRTGGRAFDADEARERARLPRREEAGAAMAEAIWDRRKKHRASPRTDPAPDAPHNPSPVGKTVHPVGPTHWKDGNA
ncbi:MAG: hypothetical protein AB7E70_20160 [Hyphomicrobiaceae bacterium]